jgi:hypothetical protein
MGCDVCIGTSDYDPADVYSVSVVKARKPHRCCECRQVIQPGIQYERVSMLYDGEWQRYDTCESCMEIRNVFACGEGWLFTTVWDDIREYVFPELTTASECFRELSAVGKQRVMDEWRKWKGL